MPDAQDMDLVRAFARHNSEAAFTELVRRHIGLVYSVARRCTGNADDAKDVTQAVFIILARKAAGLRERTLLPGWLYETTRFTATRLLRDNVRRQKREQEGYMQSTLNEAGTADVWERLSPHLEDAMSKLAERDRALLVLRFYQNKSGPEAAALLGIREGAAHMRVTRALEKLRKFFAQRRVALSGEAIAGAISANSIQAAPAGLAATIATTALAGTAVSTATIVAATKAMAMTTLQKTLVTVSIAALAGAGVYQAHRAAQHHAQNQTLQQQQARLLEEVQRLQHERDEAKRQLAALRDEKERSDPNPAELLKLRGEVGVLRRQMAEANIAKRQSSAPKAPAGQPADLIEQQKQMSRVKGADGKNYSMHFILFASDNQGWFPTNWPQVASFTNNYPVSGTNDFELVHKRPINLAELGTNAGKTILVRESLAWPTVDGQWGKCYGFADGHSQVIILPDGNFTAWEEQNTFNPESIVR